MIELASLPSQNEDKEEDKAVVEHEAACQLG